MLTMTSASAKDLDAYITADEQTGNIAVSGTGAAYGGQLVSILIAKNESEFFSPDTPLITEATQADENGGYDIQINPYPSLSGGEYTAKIATADQWISKKFVLVSVNSATDLYELAKECKSKDELETLLGERPYDMGISEDYWQTYQKQIVNRIYSGLKDCKNTSDFLKLCRSGLAIERIKAGEDITSVLADSKNSMYVGGTTIYEMWNTLSENARQNVMNLYTDSTDVAGAFAQACAVAAVKDCKNWRELSEVLSPLDKTVFTEVFELDTTYCTSTNADAIVGQLYSKLAGLKNIKAIRDTFFNISKEYSTKNANSNAGGGNGGTSFGKQWSSEGFSAVTGNTVKVSFNDIQGHWGERYITPLAQRGIVNGYDDGGFHPNAYVTRAEFVKMLCSGFNITGEYSDAGFADVSNSAWYAQSVALCKSHGIVNGDTNNRFRPQERITREDAAVMLYRILKEDIAFEETEQLQFNDSTDIADYAVGAVATMADEGIISGFDTGSFRPKDNTTRAQAAVMLIKAVDLLNAES